MAGSEENSGMLFKDLITANKTDAEAQDSLVNVIVDILEWECAQNDAELVSAALSSSWLMCFLVLRVLLFQFMSRRDVDGFLFADWEAHTCYALPRSEPARGIGAGVPGAGSGLQRGELVLLCACVLLSGNVAWNRHFLQDQLLQLPPAHPVIHHGRRQVRG
eukprot:3390890-Rhodomonas_salina.1